jgi:heat shock protein HslJ
MTENNYMRIYWIALTGLIVILIVASACTPSGLPPDIDQPALEGTGWTLVQINGQEPLAGTEVTLIFEETNVEGNTGCNHFGGEYTASPDGSLQMSQLAMTEIYCTEPEGVMAQEVQYGDNLNQATSYRVVDERLEILNQDGVTILIFERR